MIKRGDCLELLKEITDNQIDLIVTDPPYKIETRGGGLATNGQVKQWKERHLDGMKDGFSPKILDELCRVMKKINCYFFCSQKQIMPLLDYFVREKKCNWNLLIWGKTNPVPACGNKYLSDTEYILFFREKGVRVYGTYDTKHTYYISKSNHADKKKYGHPTCKPEELVANLIVNSSEPGQIVLDPFMGSGTTGVAAKHYNREFIGFEIDPRYFAIAEQRILNNEKVDRL